MKFNITLFAFFIFCISAFAQVPRYITHQGFLTKPSGAPYDTTIAMTFRVYLDSSGGTSIYEQTISSVSVSKGIFNVALGSLSLAFDKQYYIEVQAGNQTLSPRVKLSSSAYALRADTAANLPAASNIFYNNGSVGIGTTNPSGNLEVQGVSNPQLYIHSTGVNSTPELAWNNGSAFWDLAIRGSLNHSMSFRIGGEHHMLITTGGYVGLGTTSPRAKLEINAGSNTNYENTVDGAAAVFTSGGTQSKIIFNAGTKYHVIRGDNSGNIVITPDGGYVDLYSTVIVKSNGNVGIGTANPTQALFVNGNICYTGSIGTCSDLRYKKDITPLSNALANVSRLNGVNYNWRTDEFPDKKFNKEKQIGLIAQDVEKVYPEVVITDVDGYKSVDYAKLVPALIEAIKQQQKQIDGLNKTVSSLQQKVEQASLGDLR